MTPGDWLVSALMAVVLAAPAYEAGRLVGIRAATKKWVAALKRAEDAFEAGAKQLHESHREYEATLEGHLIVARADARALREHFGLELDAGAIPTERGKGN